MFQPRFLSLCLKEQPGHSKISPNNVKKRKGQVAQSKNRRKPGAGSAIMWVDFRKRTLMGQDQTVVKSVGSAAGLPGFQSRLYHQLTMVT